MIVGTFNDSVNPTEQSLLVMAAKTNDIIKLGLQSDERIVRLAATKAAETTTRRFTATVP